MDLGDVLRHKLCPWCGELRELQERYGICHECVRGSACGAREETSDVASKLGHSSHVCVVTGNTHVEHRCGQCGDTWQDDMPHALPDALRRKGSACPVCKWPGGFHDSVIHGQHDVPRELIKPKDWHKVR